jgi:hypothetical protein
MIVLLHVVVALISMATISAAFVRTSQLLLSLSYMFFGGTVVSGAYLLWIGPHSIIQACVSGLAYMAVASTGIIMTRRKLLANQTSTQ